MLPVAQDSVKKILACGATILACGAQKSCLRRKLALAHLTSSFVSKPFSTSDPRSHGIVLNGQSLTVTATPHDAATTPPGLNPTNPRSFPSPSPHPHTHYYSSVLQCVALCCNVL